MSASEVTSIVRHVLRRAADSSEALAPAVHVREKAGWTQTRVTDLDGLARLYQSVGQSLAAVDGVADASASALRTRVLAAEDAVKALRTLRPDSQHASSFQPSSASVQSRVTPPRPEQALVQRIAGAAPGSLAAELRRIAG